MSLSSHGSSVNAESALLRGEGLLLVHSAVRAFTLRNLPLVALARAVFALQVVAVLCGGASAPGAGLFASMRALAFFAPDHRGSPVANTWVLGVTLFVNTAGLCAVGALRSAGSHGNKPGDAARLTVGLWGSVVPYVTFVPMLRACFVTLVPGLALSGGQDASLGAVGVAGILVFVAASAGVVGIFPHPWGLPETGRVHSASRARPRASLVRGVSRAAIAWGSVSSWRAWLLGLLVVAAAVCAATVSPSPSASAAATAAIAAVLAALVALYLPFTRHGAHVGAMGALGYAVASSVYLASSDTLTERNSFLVGLGGAALGLAAGAATAFAARRELLALVRLHGEAEASSDMDEVASRLDALSLTKLKFAGLAEASRGADPLLGGGGERGFCGLLRALLPGRGGSAARGGGVTPFSDEPLLALDSELTAVAGALVSEQRRLATLGRATSAAHAKIAVAVQLSAPLSWRKAEATLRSAMASKAAVFFDIIDLRMLETLVRARAENSTRERVWGSLPEIEKTLTELHQLENRFWTSLLFSAGGSLAGSVIDIPALLRFPALFETAEAKLSALAIQYPTPEVENLYADFLENLARKPSEAASLRRSAAEEPAHAAGVGWASKTSGRSSLGYGMPVSRTVSSQSRVAPGLSSKPRAATAAERSMLLSASASVPPQPPTTILELVASEQTLPGEAAPVRKPGVNFIDPSPVIGRKRQASQSSAKSSNATPRSPEIMGRSVSNSSAGGVYGGAAYGAGPSSASKLGMMVMSPGRSAVGIHSSGGYGSSGALLQAQRIVEDDDVMGIRDRLRSTGRGLALGFTIATLAAVLLTWLAGPIAVLWRSDLVPVTQLQTTSVVHHGTLRWRMAMCVEATREVAQGLLNPGVTAAALQGHLASSLMSERSVAEGLETLKANRRGAQESANIAFIRSGLARKEDTLTNAWSTSELQVERIEGSALVARNVTLLTYLSLSFSYMDELIKIASEQSLPLAPQAQTRVRLLAGALVRSFLDSGNAAIDEAGSAMAILLGAKTKEVSREIRVASWALMIAGAVVWFACALPLGLVMTKMQRDTLDTLQRIPKVDVAKARNRAAALHSEASMLEVAGPDGANLWGGGDPASQSGSEGTESLGLAHSSRSLSASAAAATSSSSKATNFWKASPGTMSLAVSLFLVVFACAVSVGVYARTAAALSAQAFASNVEIINANQLSTHSEISLLYLTEGLWTALGAANATGPVTAVGVWAPTAGRLVLAPRAQDNILECTAHYRSLLYGGVSGDQSAFTDASRTDLLKGFMGTRLHRDVARDMLAVKCTSDGLCEDTTWRMEAYIHSIVEASESLQEGGLEAAFEQMEGARLWYRESLRAWARSLVDAFSHDLASESTSQVSGTAVVSTIGLGILALLCALVFLPLVAEHHARTKASLFLLCLLPLAALEASRGSLELAGLSVSVRRQGSGSSDRGKGKKGGGGEDDDGGGGGSGDNEHGHRSRGVLGWFFKKRRPEAGGGEFGPSTRKNPKPLLDVLIESLAVSEDRVLVLDDTASVVWANENLLRLTVGHSLTPLLATSISEFVRDSRCQTLVLDFARRAKAAEVGGDVPAQPVVRLDTPLYLPGQEASYPSRIHVRPLLLAGSVFAVVSAKDIGLEIEFDNSRKDFDKARRLIQSFVPPSIAKRLEVAEEPFAERYPACVVIFIDLVNFTAIASSLTASKLASLLSVVFASICDTYYLDRIKTIGDGYMAVGGLFDDTFPLLAPETNTEMRAIWAGLEVHRALEKINSKFNTNFHARVGIHTGHVVAGVMSLTRVSFDVYGDTVNIASRCESTGTPGFVHVTSETFEAANLNAPWFSGKAQEVTFKGKSHPHTTYLIGQGDILKPLPASYVPGGQVVGDKDDTDLKFE